MVDGFIHDELGKLSFVSTAKFRSSVAWPEEDVRGVVSPSDAPYGLKVSRNADQIMFELTEPGGTKSGLISVALPSQYVHFYTDTREQKHEFVNGPALYHEWRFEGPVALKGIFAATTKTAKAWLILHGRGNRCVSADSFHAWMLTVEGRDVNFTLLGRFKQVGVTQEQEAPARK